MTSVATDAYRGIAGHYDLHMMDWYATTYGKRVETLLESRGLAGSLILDAGCGTGSFALALADRGYRVTGVDLSESLLRQARRKDAGGRVRWIHGDLRSLDVGGSFDVVVSVADVLNHLETLDDWETVFRRFAAALRPGGLLIFDCLTALGLERQDTYTIRDGADGALILGIIWEPASRRSTMKITSYRRRGDTDLWERAAETIVEWAQPVQGILDRLARAGFVGPERPWRAADDPEGEERLAVVATRP